MNNDYERYDFWHREMKSIKSERSISKLIESNKKTDKDSNDTNERTEYILNITQDFI